MLMLMQCIQSCAVRLALIPERIECGFNSRKILNTSVKFILDHERLKRFEENNLLHNI